MTKTWKRQMEEAVIRIAFPDWELRDDDVITIHSTFEYGVHADSSMDEMDTTTISVEVKRSYLVYPDHKTPKSMWRYTYYENDAAAELWNDLMSGKGDSV